MSNPPVIAGIINYFYLWVQVQDCRLDLTLLFGCSPVAVRRIVACFPAPDIAEAGLIAEISHFEAGSFPFPVQSRALLALSSLLPLIISLILPIYSVHNIVSPSPLRPLWLLL